MKGDEITLRVDGTPLLQGILGNARKYEIEHGARVTKLCISQPHYDAFVYELRQLGISEHMLRRQGTDELCFYSMTIRIIDAPGPPSGAHHPIFPTEKLT